MNKKFFKLGALAALVLAANFVPYVGTSQITPAKVKLCHRGQTIEVVQAIVAAHLAHGDTAGPCVVTPSEN